jgi:hypothetical protein
VIKPAAPLQTPLQLYDFLFETYGKSTRQDLLRFLENRTGIEELGKLSCEELAEIYCEGLVYTTMARTNAQNTPWQQLTLCGLWHPQPGALVAGTRGITPSSAQMALPQNSRNLMVSFST